MKENFILQPSAFILSSKVVAVGRAVMFAPAGRSQVKLAA
jgi:hypothetical protein